METPPSSASSMDAVQVCVRIRPLSSREKQEQAKSCIRIAASSDGLSSTHNNATPTASSVSSNGPQQLIVGKDRAFTFDNVLGITSTQVETYRHCVAPLVQGFIEGYNATVLAYGQTGTGKTHTMSGSGLDAKGDRHEELQGIIPRVIKSIFKHMKENEQHVEYSLRIEYIEIYNEELRDLLHPETTSKQLTIREDAEGRIVIAGVKSEVASTQDAVFRYLVLGGASRATGSTLMNEQSSRSHAIFTLILHQRELATGACRKAKFHLVDLAGSERAKRTGAVATRFKESVSINQGLLALGNVISALGDEKRRNMTTTTGNGGVHVPYRDSKLTRLLQDSLGGNSKTLMIACVSPAAINFEETLNTLKYANRAKNIRNRPIVNQHEVSSTDDELAEQQKQSMGEIARMRAEIAHLHTQLQQSATGNGSNGTAPSSRPTTSSSSSSSIPASRSGKREHSSSSSGAEVKLAALEQEVHRATKKAKQCAECVETMRGFSLEAITSLIAMEREIKPLGRPVQQQLNEIVKRLNAVIQTANSCDTGTIVNNTKGDQNNADDAGNQDERIKRMAKELQDAKNDLLRDEQIFEMKNQEIQRLHTLLLDAKAKNEKLIEKVQQLERGGQLWSNVESSTTGNISGSSAEGGGMGLVSPSTTEEGGDDHDDEEEERAPTARTAARTSTASGIATSHGLRDAKATSSRGLFTKRGGTATYDGEEDNVLIGNGDDDDVSLCGSRATSRKALKSRSDVPAPPTAKPGFECLTTATSSSLRGSTESGAATIAKLEKTIASLRAKVEQLQQQNGELLHVREESTRRWQLDRQNYERQINEAEQTIEALRKEKQALEDTIIETEKHSSNVAVAESKSSMNLRSSSHHAKKSLFLEIEEPETTEDERTPPPSDEKQTSMRSSSSKEIKSFSNFKPLASIFEECITRLMEYNEARRQVLNLIKEKQEAQLHKDEANRRVNALEMQKLRQSLSLRESISDVSKSLSIINEKMQAQTRTQDELERLKKLKDRAERKLKVLREQEEQDTFLDQNAQQELADLEELIEDLNSHIAFQDAELSKAREDLQSIKMRSQAEDASPIDTLTHTIVPQLRRNGSSEDATAFVRKMLEDTSRLRGREQELLGKVNELQSVIDDRETALRQLESGLGAARKEFDRRLELERQEHGLLTQQLQDKIASLIAQQQQQLAAAKAKSVGSSSSPGDDLEPTTMTRDDAEWKKLIVSYQKKSEYIADLEKHLVFYKSKAKQMQAQLQQLIRDSSKNCNQHSNDDDDEEDTDRSQGGGEGEDSNSSRQLRRRIQQLEKTNDALTKDLATAKS
uniref:Kinesin motor domain-containing protein n=1 Tax=Globisporangium ultimum (strain ATCC 200006 / CBS 805.95 / DAOM BR144) TaxID=431595 RepID=K3W7F6_GLOUD